MKDQNHEDEQKLQSEIQELESTLEYRKELESLRAERDQLKAALEIPGEQYSTKAMCPACQKEVQITTGKGQESEQLFNCPFNSSHTFSAAGAIRAAAEAEEQAPNPAEQISFLKKEIKKLRKEKNMSELRERKNQLKQETQSYGKEYTVNGHCPICRQAVVFTATKGRENTDQISCPYNDTHRFTAKEATEHIARTGSLETSQNQSYAQAFSDKLGTFRIYTVLTVFLDSFFMIFTILGFSEKGKLSNLIDQYPNDIPQDQINSFNNWKIGFLVIFWIKVIAIGIIAMTVMTTPY